MRHVTRLALQIVSVSAVVLALGKPTRQRASTRVHACHENPHLVGPCFTFHGRMSLANGSPGVRILRIGTGRILGVPETGELLADSNYCAMPAWMLDTLATGRKDIIGDFTVCPLTVSKPGVMQMVCVDSVARVVTQHSSFFGP